MSENGQQLDGEVQAEHVASGTARIDGPDEGKPVQEVTEDFETVRAERDAYARAAQISEQNELLLFRRLWGYLDAELERKDAEIARLKRREADREADRDG